MDITRRKQTRQVQRDLEASLKESTRREAQPDWNQELRPRRQRKPRGVWKKLLLLFLILVLLGLGSLLGTYYYVKTAPLGGENSGRVNIMVLGIDKVARLSDTIMIVSIDTRTGQEPKLAMVSLPRDLYVQIPGVGGSKINAAYSNGENSDNGGGGVALAQKTLEQNFNLKIHHYAVLNFEGLRDLVDAVGGVDVDVKTAIDDPFFPKPDYSGVTTFSISAGLHHMDGDLALDYTRSRYTTSDFDRAARQQQVLAALKAKATSPSILLNPARLQSLQNVIEDNLESDLSLRQIAKLYLIFRSIEAANVSQHVIDSTNYLAPASFGGGAFVPRTGNFGELNSFIANIFSQSGNTLPETQE